MPVPGWPETPDLRVTCLISQPCVLAPAGSSAGAAPCQLRPSRPLPPRRSPEQRRKPTLQPRFRAAPAIRSIACSSTLHSCLHDPSAEKHLAGWLAGWLGPLRPNLLTLTNGLGVLRPCSGPQCERRPSEQQHHAGGRLASSPGRGVSRAPRRRFKPELSRLGVRCRRHAVDTLCPLGTAGRER